MKGLTISLPKSSKPYQLILLPGVYLYWYRLLIVCWSKPICSMAGNGYDISRAQVVYYGVDMIGYDGMLSPSKTQLVCTAGGRCWSMAHSGGTLAST